MKIHNLLIIPSLSIVLVGCGGSDGPASTPPTEPTEKVFILDESKLDETTIL